MLDLLQGTDGREEVARFGFLAAGDDRGRRWLAGLGMGCILPACRRLVVFGPVGVGGRDSGLRPWTLFLCRRLRGGGTGRKRIEQRRLPAG